MKRWMIIVACVLVGLLILGVAKDLIIKVAVETGTQVVTGLKLKMGSFSAGLINTVVHIKNMRVLNPAGFKDPNMLVMPEIYVAYDLPAIFGGKVHLKEVRLNMKEFTVVKNEKGQLNLDSLKVVQAEKSGAKPQSVSGGKAPEIQIDKLNLKIGKVYYKDYSKGGQPSVKEFNLNINEEYTNINNPYTLVSLIVVRALMNTSIANLTNFDLGGLQGSVSGTLAGAQKAVERATQTAQQAHAVATETTKKATEAVKGVTGALGAFKNPFGGDNQ